MASCPAGTKIDSHSELDLVVTREFSESLDAYLTIMNVTDEEDIVARAPKNAKGRASRPSLEILDLLPQNSSKVRRKRGARYSLQFVFQTSLFPLIH